MNIDQIIEFVEEKIVINGSKRDFLNKAGLGINTFQHFKKEKDIRLSTLIKMLDVLNYDINFVEKE